MEKKYKIINRQLNNVKILKQKYLVVYMLDVLFCSVPDTILQAKPWNSLVLNISLILLWII